MKAIIKPIVVLSLICIITAALLGMTYNITAPLIAQTEKAASDAAMANVLPSAQAFEELKGETTKNDALDGMENVLMAAKDEGGSGYVFKVKDKGFGGAFVVMVGIGSDGKITGTQLLENTETPGLGSKAGLPAFTDQFLGKENSMEGVSAIAGATISSKTFFRCINTAYEAYQAVGEGV